MLYKYIKIHNDRKLAEIVQKIDNCGAGKVNSFEGWYIFKDKKGTAERLVKEFKERELDIQKERRNQGL